MRVLGSHRMICRLVLGLIGLSAAVGCGKAKEKAPPEPPRIEPAAVEIPVSAQPGDPRILGYLRLGDLNQVIDRLGNYTSMIQPGMDAAALRAQYLAMGGVQLADFQPGRDSIVAVLEGGAFPSAPPPVLGLFPIAAESPSAQALTAAAPQAQLVPAGAQQTLLATDEAAKAVAGELQSALENLAGASSPHDLEISLNIETLMARFGQMLRGQLSMISTMMSMRAQGQQPGGGVDPQAMARSVVSQGGLVLDALDQMRSLTVGLQFGESAIDLDAIVASKPGTALAEALTMELASAPNLTSYLPAGRPLRAQIIGMEMGDLVQKKMSAMAGAFGGKLDPEKLKSELAGVENVGRTDMAVSYGISAEKRLEFEGVYQVENAEEFMRVFDAMMTSMVNGSLNEMYKVMGLRMRLTVERDARQIEGRSVNRYMPKFEAREGAIVDPQVVESLRLMDTQIEICRVNSLVLVATGTQMDALAGRVLSGGAAEPLAALNTFPGGGWFYADLNLPALLDAIRRMAPEGQGAMVPNLAMTAPPISVAAYHQSGQGYYRLSLPRALFASLGGFLPGQGNPAGSQ